MIHVQVKRLHLLPVMSALLSNGSCAHCESVPMPSLAVAHIQLHQRDDYSQVMEVQPAELAEHMELQSRTLEPGKATCVLSAQYQRCCLNIQLMDVLDLQLSL